MNKISKKEEIKLLNEKLKKSLENEINILNLNDSDYKMCVEHIKEYIRKPFRVNNYCDRQFMNIIEYVWRNNEEILVLNMIKRLDRIRFDNEELYESFVNYFKTFDLWETFNPKLNDWTTLKLRALTLKRYSYTFIWLYRRLDDYLSKRTLTAILLNWAWLEFPELQIVKSIFNDYWEPDFFKNNHQDVLVDCGAYTGDSIESYVNFYGRNYKKIYAYEIMPSLCEQLKENIQKLNLHNVEVRQNGIGSKKGEFYIKNNNYDSANQISSSGEVKVNVVKIDDDIKENITFIKMDIEGAEKDALLGAKRTIKELKPKLAISVYHGYEDIYKIPYMINKMNPNYEFHLRHNGGDLIPTEFVLLCKNKD